ncbi:MAG: hypothetical protein H8E09_00660 [Gammaproteobacteria bacterium]|nr:hypothetical protein [Gammaproteobacteria bacterium]MBL7003305.1 hypothetical protein [Gammaproteobacteria bacterium]
MKNVELQKLYLDIASGMASHLYENQVVSDNIILDFTQDTKLNVDLPLIRKSKKNVPLVFKKNESAFLISGKNNIRVESGQFFRVSLPGELSTIKDFMGLKPNHKGIELPKTNSNNSIQTDNQFSPKKIIKSIIINRFPYIKPRLVRIRDHFFPEPETELSNKEGISFRILPGTLDREFILECYDQGGIYDEHLNAEGITYPSQVPGNYYADAYSLLLFMRLYEQEHDNKWLEAAESSWSFLKRIYPQYKPAGIVWHHSDFKNAGLLEFINQYSKKYPQFRWGDEPLVEDRYEPTNVFALRYHWKSIAIKLGRNEESLKFINADLLHLINDQTLDGLYHDNISTYPDAHDLTYHQYSTACLGQGLLHRDDPDGLDSFMKAVTFTLNVLGPDGEPAYTGRASNNIHHSASTILAFHIASKFTDDQEFIAQLQRGAIKIAERVKKYQLPNGMIPTGLNHEIAQRMAWNHCETPYNGLAGYFLLRSLDFLDDSKVSTTQLPLEKTQQWLANDAGFATISDGQQYLVIFSGCAESYGWSEDRHKTGCAGIALLGELKNTSVTPCLDYDITHSELVSDLPEINGKSPFGRGQLKIINGSTITLTLHYGEAFLTRKYQLNQGKLVLDTVIQCKQPCNINGIVSWFVECSQRDPKSIVVLGNDTIHIKDNSFEVFIHSRGLDYGTFTQCHSQEINNPKGVFYKYSLDTVISKTINYQLIISPEALNEEMISQNVNDILHQGIN